ncbi:hypothetical protein CLV78_101969 [Aliiruegeria haliotis]|uniref:Uncharacterized protein n=1 Tax=Aliiruegeria haliotis TaxID=1280846 RepID=A0A2T0S0C6_9RHOB|nr:hypothetical protein CLV78_101969 [Aliiruegeria haliotis]
MLGLLLRPRLLILTATSAATVRILLIVGVTFPLTLAVLLFLLLATGFLFPLRLAQHSRVVLGMLLEVLGGYTVVAKRRIAGKLGVLVDNLLRGATHLAFRTGRIEDPVDNVPYRPLTVRLGTRT